MTNVPEVTTPGDEELWVLVIDPAVSTSDQGVGDGVTTKLVKVNHPHSMISLSSYVNLTTTWASI